MKKTTLKAKYPFLEVSLPGRDETFLLQTDNPQWLIQILVFKDDKQYKSFIKKQCIGTYAIDDKYRIAAMTVSPLQTVEITQSNLKEENTLQEKIEKEALDWWINKLKEEIEEENISERSKLSLSEHKLAKDLRIGNNVESFKSGTILIGIYDEMTNRLPNLESGDAFIELHTHGIRIRVGSDKFDIHNSQIIDMQKKTAAEIIQSPKFAYGKAALGGWIAGPLGIFLGGISSKRFRNEINVNTYLVIDYWDQVMLTEQSIVIFCDNNQPIKQFIELRKKEMQKNIDQKRLPQKETMRKSVILLIIIFILFVLTLIITFIMMGNN